MRGALRTAAILLAGGLLLSGCGGDDTESPDVELGQTLTPKQARFLATALANRAFRDKQFTDADGQPVPTVKLAPKDWRVAEQNEAGRWIFTFDPPTGPQADVSFGPDGDDAQVKVGYASQ